VSILGRNSGFKTARDLILFVIGLAICIFHVVTTKPVDLSIPLLMFGGGLAGAPYIIRNDERRGDRERKDVGA
jgi:hypothetical protein